MNRSDRLSTIFGTHNSKTGIRIKNSRVKRTRFRMTKRQVILILIMLILYMGSGIGYVWSTFERTQIGYDISQLKNEELRLKEIGRKLRLELAFLRSPENLERQATRHLNLRQPTPEQIVVLK